MTYNELKDWIVDRLPDASLDEDADGEIIIGTGLKLPKLNAFNFNLDNPEMTVEDVPLVPLEGD